MLVGLQLGVCLAGSSNFGSDIRFLRLGRARAPRLISTVTLGPSEIWSGMNGPGGKSLSFMQPTVSKAAREKVFSPYADRAAG